MNSQHTYDYVNSQHTYDYVNSQHTYDYVNSQHTYDYVNSQHTYDYVNSQHTYDYVNSQHTYHYVNSQHNYDNVNSQHTYDYVNSQHTYDYVNSQHNYDNVNSQHTYDYVNSQRFFITGDCRWRIVALQLHCYALRCNQQKKLPLLILFEILDDFGDYWDVLTTVSTLYQVDTKCHGYCSSQLDIRSGHRLEKFYAYEELFTSFITRLTNYFRFFDVGNLRIDICLICLNKKFLCFFFFNMQHLSNWKFIEIWALAADASC